MKAIKLNGEFKLEDALQEVKVMLRIKHKHIVKLVRHLTGGIAAQFIQRTNTFNIFMEYIPGIIDNSCMLCFDLNTFG